MISTCPLPPPPAVSSYSWDISLPSHCTGSGGPARNSRHQLLCRSQSCSRCPLPSTTHCFTGPGMYVNFSFLRDKANGHIREKEPNHISRKELTWSTISATQLAVHLAGHTMVQHFHTSAVKNLFMPPNTPATSLFRNGHHTRPSTFPLSPLSAPQAPIKGPLLRHTRIARDGIFLATSIDFLPWQ